MIGEIIIAAILLLNYGYVESGTNPLTITGGNYTSTSTHKFMVAIHIQSHPIYAMFQHRCVGSILSPTLVITAAHCVHNLTANRILVHVGSSNPMTGGRYESISEIFEHGNYDSDRRINDISLLLLRSNLTFNDSIGAINLPKVGEMKCTPSMLIKAIGFGETGMASYTRTLQEADLWILFYVVCKRVYRIEMVSQFCAANVNITLGNRDEGSPVLYENKLIGIVSRIADNEYRRGVTVIVKVPDYLEFIQQIMRQHP